MARPVQRDTQWESARYGTGFGLMIGAHQKRPPGHLASVGSPQLPGVPFGLLPRLIYPTTPLTTPPCQRALVGHFLFSAKFICMGKQKNRLTAVQTIYQHAQRNPSPQGRPHHISHSAKPPGLPWSFNILLVQPRAVQGRPPDSGNSRKSPRLPCSPRQEITGKFIRVNQATL